MIRTAILLLYLAVIIPVFGPLLILYGLLGGSMDRFYFMGMRWVIFPLPFLGVRTRVEGVENIPAGACVFASNHVSNVDPLVTVRAIPCRIAILAKKSLFRVPVMGKAWRMAGFTPIDRSDRASAINSIRDAAGHLKQGISFLIYPEGTRSPDGRLQPFKRAGFALAIEAGVPVVPLACIGTQRIWPKGSFGIRSGEAIVRFCPPIDAAAYAINQRQELADAVHAALSAALPPEQRPFDAASDATLSALRRT